MDNWRRGRPLAARSRSPPLPARVEPPLPAPAPPKLHFKTPLPPLPQSPPVPTPPSPPASLTSRSSANGLKSNCFSTKVTAELAKRLKEGAGQGGSVRVSGCTGGEQREVRVAGSKRRGRGQGEAAPPPAQLWWGD